MRSVLCLSLSVFGGRGCALLERRREGARSSLQPPDLAVTAYTERSASRNKGRRAAPLGVIRKVGTSFNSALWSESGHSRAVDAMERTQQRHGSSATEPRGEGNPVTFAAITEQRLRDDVGAQMAANQKEVGVVSAMFNTNKKNAQGEMLLTTAMGTALVALRER